MSRLPAGVCVVSAATSGGAEAITATSVVPVSLDPPMLLFCVHADARLREVLDRSDTWAVSVLDASARGVADWLATPGRPSLGQLAPVPHRRGATSGAALVQAADAWVECRTSWVRGAGDHDVVVGEVLAVETSPTARGALLHWMGRTDVLPG